MTRADTSSCRPPTSASPTPWSFSCSRPPSLAANAGPDGRRTSTDWFYLSKHLTHILRHHVSTSSSSSSAPPPYQPLVRGGHARQPDKLPSMFISSTVPVVHENTIILGVTHPTLSTASPKDDGWFISDFYAFNYLFKGLGMQQTWLTAVEPAKLVKKYGSFLHGNPYEERKICLSQELLDSDELSPVTVVSPARMIDQFLIEARRASELAKRTSAPLLLLIFCHGLPNFHLLLNNGDTQRGLSRPRLSSML